MEDRVVGLGARGLVQALAQDLVLAR